MIADHRKIAQAHALKAFRADFHAKNLTLLRNAKLKHELDQEACEHANRAMQHLSWMRKAIEHEAKGLHITEWYGVSA